MSTTGQTLLTLVTGATSGVGVYTVYELTQRGHRVLLGCRTLEKARATLEKLKGEFPEFKANLVEPLVINLEDDASIAAAAKTVEEKFGVLDILVNNAAVSHSPDQDAAPRETYSTIFMTNVAGTHLVTQAFLPLIRKSTAPAPGRRIVNISTSLSSLHYTISGAAPIVDVYMAYAASKTALNLITNYYVHQLRDEQITVVTGSPGWCDTELSLHLGPKSTKDGAKDVVNDAIVKGDFESMHGKFYEDGNEVPW